MSVYLISSLALPPAPTKPPNTQVYYWNQNPPIPGPTPTASSPNLAHSDDLQIPLRNGKWQCINSISPFVTYTHFSSSSCSFIVSLDSISLPNTVHAASSNPIWCNAMVDAMQTLENSMLPIAKESY